MLPVTKIQLDYLAGGCSNENQLLNLNILMLLGNNCGISVHKRSQRTTAIPFSNEVSVEIFDCIFQIAFTDKQAILIKTTAQLYS